MIFSLLVQGLTIKPLVNMLGINKGEEIIDDYEDVIIKMANAETALEKTQQLHEKGQLQKSIYIQLKSEQEKVIEQLIKEETELLEKYPKLKEKQINDVMQIIRKSQLITIKELLNEHIIDDLSANKHS